MTSLRNVLTISKNGNDRKYGDSDSVSIDVFILTTMAPRPTHKGVKRFAPAAAPAFFCHMYPRRLHKRVCHRQEAERSENHRYKSNAESKHTQYEADIFYAFLRGT
mmetsp:Transcript_4508/g.14918  ORF Transcript_4508/g.14918 Transcript_4508/m.14918 type:complete len:106 (-) Transcript_4508:1748-2065(-)